MYAVRITHFFSENTEELQRFRNALVRISEGVESRSIPSESGECDYEVLQNGNLVFWRTNLKQAEALLFPFQICRKIRQGRSLSSRHRIAGGLKNPV